jgi:hypothetical protein
MARKKITIKDRAIVKKRLAQGASLSAAIKGTAIRSKNTARKIGLEDMHDIARKRKNYVKLMESMGATEYDRANMMAKMIKAKKPHGPKSIMHPDWKSRSEAVKYIDTFYLQSDRGKIPVEKETIYWKPHPGKQTEALTRSEFEILYGGARGGGKTDAGIAWLLREAHNPLLRALIIRKNYEDLEDWLDRAARFYAGVGARIVGKPARIIFPSGALMRAGHLKDPKSYTKYLGHEYQRMLIEELTLIPSELDYLKILTSLRSTVEGLDPRMFCTTNPGGVGHGWVKERFIDVAKWGEPYIDPETGRSRIFIQATMDDNPTLMTMDPAYVQQIEALKDKDEALYRAWRFGDWDVFVGQMFAKFRRNTHVINPMIPRKDTLVHYIGMDWGYSGKESDKGAFAAVSLALIREYYEDVPFHRIVQYLEWYDKHKTPHEWAEIMFKTSPIRKFREARADASMFNKQSDGSKPIQKLFQEKWKQLNNKRMWMPIKPGTRNRIARVATLQNWLSEAPDGLPYFLITENCQHTIRTIPLLLRDEHNPEDVDTDSEDHPYDALTYMLSNIKFISVQKRIKQLPQRYKKVQKQLPTDKHGNILSVDTDKFAIKRARPRNPRV